jgi:exopolysaccharide biosynthesis polyprenyl glycosylphosphotransferase
VAALVPGYRIDEIVVADPALSHQQIMAIVSQCAANPVDIKVFPDVFQIMSSQVTVGDLNGMPMLTVRDAALRGYNLALKRAVDIVVSLTMLIVFSWFMLLIAFIVKLTDPRGPVFFVQERVGLNGEVFPTLKFRSMYVDAEEKTGPIWARKGDPRVTPIGRIIRRFSIDELPQFINVLIGQMSVVGPRPERPHFVQQFSERLPRYLERHREKTGLTGWAQVNGLRGDTSIEERTAYDLWYVENWTLGLDLKIMLRTVIAIFRDKNAY